MGYSNIQDENNNEDFKKFLVKAIIWTVILTVAGIFLFPFLGWMINNMRTIFIALIVMCSIAGVLLLARLVPFIVRVASKRTYVSNLKLLFFALSLGCIAGVNLGLFDKFCADHIDGKSTLRRWGNCMVSYTQCYSRFGIKKLDTHCGALTYLFEEHSNRVLYRIYNEDWEKVIVMVTDSYEEEKNNSSSYWGKNVFHTMSGKIYDTEFNYLGELDVFKRSAYRSSEGGRYEYNGSDKYTCICGGNGRCTQCAGQGGHYEVQYY